MRIIAGLARGLTLAVPPKEVRPTLDRVREALFSILIPWLEDARVLDLFAGSGALGLECLSRGARSVCFVENNLAASKTLEANLAKTKLAGGRLVRQDVYRALVYQHRMRERFDLIFADPPYAKAPGEIDHSVKLLADPNLAACLAPGGMLVLEEMARRAPSHVPAPWQIKDSRDYGSTRLLFLILSPEEVLVEEALAA